MSVGRPRIEIPRQDLPFDVEIDGVRHTGMVCLHAIVCAAVASHVLPMDVIDYEFVVPWLLAEGQISPASFLKHMDRASGMSRNLVLGWLRRWLIVVWCR